MRAMFFSFVLNMALLFWVHYAIIDTFTRVCK